MVALSVPEKPLRLMSSNTRADHSPAVYLIPASYNKANALGAADILRELQRDSRLVVGSDIGRRHFINVMSNELSNTFVDVVGNSQFADAEYLRIILRVFKELQKEGAEIYGLAGLLREEGGRGFSNKLESIKNEIRKTTLPYHFPEEIVDATSFFLYSLTNYQPLEEKSLLNGAKKMIYEALKKRHSGNLSIGIVADTSFIPALNEGLRNFHPEIMENPGQTDMDRIASRLNSAVVKVYSEGRPMEEIAMAAAKAAFYAFFYAEKVIEDPGKRDLLLSGIANATSFSGISSVISVFIKPTEEPVALLIVPKFSDN